MTFLRKSYFSLCCLWRPFHGDHFKKVDKQLEKGCDQLVGSLSWLSEESHVIEIMLFVNYHYIRDEQPTEKVKKEIMAILNEYLPESYDREIFVNKTDVVFNHIVDQAMMGMNWVV